MGAATDGFYVPMTIWILRVVWATLPLTAGPAAADVLDGWATAPGLLGAVVLWAAWAGGLLATFAPRPWGLTVARATAPLMTAAAVAAVADGVPVPTGSGALAAGVAAWVLVATPAFGRASANGAAYGDERRYPLKTPPALLLGVLPAAVLLVGAGTVAGPLLLADRRWVLGAVLTLAGWTAAAATVPMLHRLSRRWVVLVPAGLVVVDPLTLADPTLFPRERIRSLRPLPGPRAPSDALDLRLGATVGSLAVELAEEATLVRAARLRVAALPCTADTLVVAPVASGALLAEAEARRLPVPPTA